VSPAIMRARKVPLGLRLNMVQFSLFRKSKPADGGETTAFHLVHK